MRAWIALSFVACVASCGKCRSEPAPAPGAPSPSTSVADAAISAARCSLVGPAVAWGGAAQGDAGEETDSPVAFGAEIGGASSDADAFFLGARGAGLTGAAVVLRVANDGGVTTALTLASNARAPLVAIGADKRLVGTMTIEEKSRVFRVAQLADGKPFVDVAQGKDESEYTAFLAVPGGALVAWDDVDAKEKRGRVLVRATASPAKKEEEEVASEASDASFPLLVPAPDGKRAALLWLAEKPETVDEDGGAGEPSQLEAHRWIEGVILDLASGKALSPVRALSDAKGHVQTHAAIWGDAGLVIVARDDPRPTDGDGGTLIAFRVPVTATLGEPSRVVVAERDVAPGTASLLPRPGGALVAWLTHDGTTRLSPAFFDGPTTVEPSLAHRRVVASRGDLALATRLVGSSIEIAVARCTP